MEFKLNPENGEKIEPNTHFYLNIRPESFSYCDDCPSLKNHSAVLYNECIFIFGGYDGRMNFDTLHVYDIKKQEWKIPEVFGDKPPGRNGHSATLVDNVMYVIGGWPGSGRYAANDIYALNLDMYIWSIPFTQGTLPGPCNMHTADLIGRTMYLFQGGNGRDYFNKLYTFDVDKGLWDLPVTKGKSPSPRANHASAVVKTSLYIFGGWDGNRKLNDFYNLDVGTMVWTEIERNSIIPSPRAGMSLCNIGNRLCLFGGTGPSSWYFYDLYIYEPDENKWEEVDSPKFVYFLKPMSGHTMTVYDRYLYIIGGGNANTYFRDMYIVDTDPPPEFPIRAEEKVSEKILSGLKSYCNNRELSDVKFMVEGKPFYGHKIVLSLLSEKFRTMFSAGMKEDNSAEVVIPHISYSAFSVVCRYLYTGEDVNEKENEGLTVDNLLELLSVSDEFILDEVSL